MRISEDKNPHYKNFQDISVPTQRLLYIHIPFCDIKCNYCAFNSYTNINHLKEKYFDAIKTQILREIKNSQIKTVFIGGGTPSTMNLNFYENLFSLLHPYIKNSEEITIECNPNTSYEWLKGIKNLGVDRISFGVQSFNEEKLKFLNRNHSPKQALKAVENAQKAGFENINIDLMYSTAIDSKKLLLKDLQTAFNLPINHISAYSLTIEKNTKWENDHSKRKNNEEMEIWFIEKIKERFRQYEISNFGTPCIHNLGYWEGYEYIGIGAGAVGFKKTENQFLRYYTLTNVKEFIKTPFKYKTEKLTKEDLKKEKIFLGLRSVLGFEEKILNKKEKKNVEILLNENKLYKKGKRIYAYDFLLADAMCGFILD